MTSGATLSRSAAMVLAYIAGAGPLELAEVPGASVAALEARGAVVVDGHVVITDAGRAAVLRWHESLGAKLHAGGRQLSDLHRRRLVSVGEDGRIVVDASMMPCALHPPLLTSLATWRQIVARVYGGLGGGAADD